MSRTWNYKLSQDRVKSHKDLDRMRADDHKTRSDRKTRSLETTLNQPKYAGLRRRESR